MCTNLKNTDKHCESIDLRKLLQHELETFNHFNRTDDTKTTPFKILNRKINEVGIPLRARFSFFMYKYLLEYSNLEGAAIYKKFFEQQLPFILEVIISIQYYHNQILDGKGGVTTYEAINENVIWGNLLKDQLYRYLEQLDLPEAQRKLVQKKVKQIFEYVDIGQYLDKNCNTYAAFLQQEKRNNPFQGILKNVVDDKCIETVLKIIRYTCPEIVLQHRSYLKLYLQRIFLTSSTTYKLPIDLIVPFLNLDKDITYHSNKFTNLYGLALQIVNDNCDLVLSEHQGSTSEKIPIDAFCDLKNHTITLPLLIHLQKCPDGNVKQYLISKKKELSEETFFSEIVQSHSIYYAMTIGKEIKKAALEYITQNNNHYNQVKNLCSLIDNNRYYKYFYKQKEYETYRKRKNHGNSNSSEGSV